MKQKMYWALELKKNGKLLINYDDKTLILYTTKKEASFEAEYDMQPKEVKVTWK